MALKPTGGAAFPHPRGHETSQHPGMSLRDYFAGEAMKNFIGSNAWLVYTDQELEKAFAKISSISFKMADAMIAERNRT